jgi:hypothetical protein
VRNTDQLCCHLVISYPDRLLLSNRFNCVLWLPKQETFKLIEFTADMWTVPDGWLRSVGDARRQRLAPVSLTALSAPGTHWTRCVIVVMQNSSSTAFGEDGWSLRAVRWTGHFHQIRRAPCTCMSSSGQEWRSWCLLTTGPGTRGVLTVPAQIWAGLWPLA